MILEYFYVERLLGSDGFFDNRLVAMNNILTTFEIVVLVLMTVDMVVDNLKYEFSAISPRRAGVGAPDGKLDLLEILIIIATCCVSIAATIRLFVNSKTSFNWDSTSVSNMTNIHGCLSFNWNTDIMHPIDFIFLILCVIPLSKVGVWSEL